jgi:orotidine-5'-phosphate decarboxylase
MFADQLIQAIREKKAPCVVGLDPNLDLIPTEFKQDYSITDANWPEESARLIEDYNRFLIDTIAEFVPAVKPQSAYYEPFGEYGIRALKNTMAYARKKGLLVILDVKRNDIGSTAQAYCRAYLAADHHRKPLMEADCMTITPYLGEDSMEPFFKACCDYGKGVFVCVKTSNPGSGDFQDLVCEDQTIYERVGALDAKNATRCLGKEGYSSIGAVVGATYPAIAQKLRQTMPQSIFLVPGYGAQGADPNLLASFFNPDGQGAIVNSSRGIMYPKADQIQSLGLRGAVEKAVLKMKQDLSGCLS